MTRRSATARRAGIALVAAGCLVLVAGASAATPPTYLTPEAMAARIHGLVPQIPTDNTSAPSTITVAACRGLPPAHGKKFATFRCTATWDEGKATVWARALAGGRYCASSTGLTSCPAASTPGDPRICAVTPPAPPTADPNRCALAATAFSIIRAMPVALADPGWTIRNLACTGSNLKRICSFSSHSAFGTYYKSTVQFTNVDGPWSAAVVTTGGGGTSTCTITPGPSGASRWSQGPAPTCTT